jgi:hypothetical protein
VAVTDRDGNAITDADRKRKLTACRVGEWFPGQIVKENRLRLTGQMVEGVLIVDRVEDLAARATFEGPGPKRVRKEVDQSTGDAHNPFPLDLPAGLRTQQVQGWAFELWQDGHKQAVVLRGKSCNGQIVDGHTVEAHGQVDDGGVLWATRVKDLTTGGIVRVRQEHTPWWHVAVMVSGLLLILALFTYAGLLTLDPNGGW